MTLAVMGLDVSSCSTGVALPDGTCTTIAPRVPAGPARLDCLMRCVVARLRTSRPDLAVIEGYFTASTPRGMSTIRLAGAGEMVRHQLWRHRVPFVEVPPATLKVYALGHAGKAATKEAMVAAARLHGAVVANDDEADAAFLRQMGLDALGQPAWPPCDRAEEALAKLVAHPIILALRAKAAA